MLNLKQFDQIYATFAPRRSDDLKPSMEKWLGFTGWWEASFVIEEGPYSGQWAMMPLSFDPSGPFQWVPECDLVSAN